MGPIGCPETSLINYHCSLRNNLEQLLPRRKDEVTHRFIDLCTLNGTSPVTNMIDQKQLENVECFKYLGSMLTNDGRCTCEIKSRIAMAKAAFNKKTLFTSKLDLNLRKKLIKCYIWSMALYGAETWTLRAADHK